MIPSKRLKWVEIILKDKKRKIHTRYTSKWQRTNKKLTR